MSDPSATKDREETMHTGRHMKVRIVSIIPWIIFDMNLAAPLYPACHCICNREDGYHSEAMGPRHLLLGVILRSGPVTPLPPPLSSFPTSPSSPHIHRYQSLQLLAAENRH
jgi:hypothetical protein